MRGQDVVNNWDFPSKISRHCHKRLVPKTVVWHDQRKMFVKNVSSQPIGLFRFCWNDSVLLTTATHLFCQRLLSHTLWSRHERFSNAKNLSNFWCSKLQHVSTYAFCRWDDIFIQKRNCTSPNNLCKCTESPSTLSTNTFIVWNLYLSWSNHLVVSYVLELNNGYLSNHQNKPSDTDRYKKYCFTRCVCQNHVHTTKRIFEQRPKLYVTECLIVHVLSSCFNVSSF